MYDRTEHIAVPSLQQALSIGPASSSGSMRLRHAKTAYATRRPRMADARLILAGAVPLAGDVVLARVVQTGQNQFLETAAGRRARLWPGDEIVVAYGDCYISDQFEARVPTDPHPCDLIGEGGVAARITKGYGTILQTTTIAPIGLLAYADGTRMNLMDTRIPAGPAPAREPLTIAVLGASMKAGKTTTCAAITRGLRACGLRVGAAKITGTAAGGDCWAQIDAGAEPMLDFTDAGHASTFGLGLPALEDILSRLTSHLANAGAEAVVLDVADGLLRPETAALLGSRRFDAALDGIIFAANDAPDAVAGIELLRRHRLPVLALSGVVSASAADIWEARNATGLPVVGPDAMATGEWLADLAASWSAGVPYRVSA